MTKKCENCIHEKVCGVLFPDNCPFYLEEPKQGEWIDKVCHIVHSTILTFMSEEEGVMSKEELLLLKVNKAICTEIKKLGGDKK